MKKTIKLLSCVLLLAIFIQSFSFSAFAFNVSDDLKDEYNILESIGIFDNITLDENAQYVTRAQLVVAAFNVLNLNKDSVSISNEFSDVGSDHFAHKEVTAFRNYGYTDGVGDNKFDPDSFITMQQGVKILLSALGSKDAAEVRGGHPRGYVEVARSLKIWDTSYGLDDFMTLDNFVQILFDTLRTSPLTITGVEGDYVIYETDDSETVFSKYFDIYSDTGILTQINEKFIDSDDEATVIINGVTYLKGDVNVSDYLGLTVDVYYKQPRNSNDKTLVYVCPSEDTKVLKLTTDDISTYSGGTYTYYVDTNKEKTATIKSSAEIYYNGANIDYFNELMIPANGTVTLVKYANSSGSQYDAVVIEDYTIAVLKNSILSDKNFVLENTISYKKIVNGAVQTITSDTAIKASSVPDFYYTVIDAEGNLSNTSALKKDMVVSIAINPYYEGAKIVFCKEVVEGKIASLSADGSSITIGDKEYDVVYGIINPTEIKVGLEGKFKLDHKGDIVAFDTAGNGYNKGALIRAEYSLTDKDIDVIFYDVDSDAVVNAVVKSDKKVKVNGVATTYEKDAGATALKVLGRRVGFQSTNTTNLEAFEIVQYKLNSENVLTEIIVLDDTSLGNGETITTANGFSNFRRINAKEAGIYDYYVKHNNTEGTGSIGSRVLVNADTTYLRTAYCPSNGGAASTSAVGYTPNEYIDYAEYYFFPRTKYMIENDQTIDELIDAYYFDDDEYADIIVEYGYNINKDFLDTRYDSYPEYRMEAGVFSGLGVVKKISKAVTENGEETEKITILGDSGSEVDLIVSPKYASDIDEPYTLKYADLGIGDIFTYNVEGGLAGNFIKVYDYDENVTDPYASLLGSPKTYRFSYSGASISDAYLSSKEIYETKAWNDPSTKDLATSTAPSSLKYNIPYRLSTGYVYKLDSDVIALSPGNNLGSNVGTLYFSIDSAIFVVIDDSTGKVNMKFGSIADVRDYISYSADASEIVAYMNNGAMKAFIIYNH